jgi:hypothetical protein
LNIFTLKLTLNIKSIIMNLRLILPLLALMSLSVWGCYPGDVTVSELDTILTLYDDENDFSQYNTYHLIDSVMHIGDEDDEIGREYDDDILAKLRDEMADAGYVEVGSIEESDIVMTVEISRSDLLVGWNPCPGCWCGYWCWYPGWPWYGYNPYYPWGGTVVYSYPVGKIFMTMYDTNDSSMEDMAVAPWAATMNGLAQGSDSQILNRILGGIEQAFNQSPYLNQ